MPIAFPEYMQGNMMPLFVTSIDNSAAGKAGPMPWKNLLIGQTTNANAPTAITAITNDEQANTLYGAGSQLALMIKAFRKNSKYIELYALGVQDAADGVAATGKITVTGTATESAPLHLMIAGQTVDVSVVSGDTAAEIMDAIVTKVTALTNLPVSATATKSGSPQATVYVTLTAKNDGAYGNGIDVRVNHNEGEVTPSGLTIAITHKSGGDDVASNLLAGGVNDSSYETNTVGAKISGTWFNAIVLGSSLAANVTYIKELLDDRWGMMVQQTGVGYYSLTGTYSDFVTAGEGKNTQVLCIPALPKSPSLPCVIAAASVAVIAQIALNDPALPLANWPVAGVVAPKKDDRLNLTENNAMLHAGVSVLESGEDGTVYVRRAITTYKRNANGGDDVSYQKLESIHTLSYLRWDWNSYFKNLHPHAKLADDAKEFGPDQSAVVTPSVAKGELLTRYKDWMSKGLVQNFKTFASEVIVERNADDENALDILIPANLIDQLFIAKSNIQFK